MKKIMVNEISNKNIGQATELMGWVSKKRNLGGLIFIDLRDRSGIMQIVVSPDNKFYEIAETLKNEYVIRVKGTIIERSNKNDNIINGDIEVNVNELEILNSSREIPFEISNTTTALEDTRLKYRYLDLRRNELNKNIITRHKLMLAVRNYLDKENFLEIETPILCKPTPEGARDYLVPSRVNNGKFYALPQSPQIFKQLLMVGGMERYFQIAKCFRDEDLRADRQPEFTQIDMEMSFVDENDVMEIAENLISNVFKTVKNIDLKTPFLKMKYDDAIELYGSDKPDLRFGMEIKDVTNIFKDTSIEFIQNKIINAIVVKNQASNYSRKDFDKLTEYVKTYKASGLIYLKNEEILTGSIIKLMTEEEKTSLINKLELEKNDLVLMIADKYDITKGSLGHLRCKIARDLNLIKSDDYKTLWVTDFPSFEYSEEEDRYIATHHPFTAPKDSDLDKLITDPGNCYSKAYDMVINGYEAGGGSIRIHNEKVQEKMFKALGLTEEEIKEKFGFFVEALKYGTPPHGGLAFGLDRLAMILNKTENIRDVIAFPKTASASCLMSECPSRADDKQLKEIHIKLRD